MARPLRLEYAGARYHVTSPGDRREDIYSDDDDRTAWLEMLGNVCARFNWVVHAYRLMTNHLEVYKKRYRHRQEAMARAYLSGAYTMREIGEYFGVHYMTVSRAVGQFEAGKG
jgi:putative transposase